MSDKHYHLFAAEWNGGRDGPVGPGRIFLRSVRNPPLLFPIIEHCNMYVMLASIPISFILLLLRLIVIAST